jgi:hypothetical protein
MRDTLELGIFVALMIAFVFVGCLATRAKKKTLKTDTPKE